MIFSPGPIASLAIIRLSAEVSPAMKAMALELETSLKEKDLSQGNFPALARARLMASTTLLKETYVQGPALEQWAAANQFVVEKISTGQGINLEIVLGTHKILRPESHGELRQSFVQGGNSQYPEVDSLNFLWERFGDQLSEVEESPLLYSASIYQWIVTMHFFEDANGRLGRLIADAVLLSAGLPPLSFENDAAAFVSALAEPDYYTVDDAVARVCAGVTHSLQILERS